MVLLGGHTESNRIVPPEVQGLVARIRPQLQERLCCDLGDYCSYNVLEFRSQVVAGMVYHLKIQTGGSSDESENESDCVHVKVFEPLPHTGEGPRILAHQRATLQDPLELL